MATKVRRVEKIGKVGSVEEALGKKSFKPIGETTEMAIEDLPKDRPLKISREYAPATKDEKKDKKVKVQKAAATVDDETDLADDSVSNAQVVRSLAKTVQVLADSQPRRVLLANHKPTSSFNPLGKRKRVLKRKMYQNGFPLNVNILTDEEISLLNQIKPGRYIKGLVSVFQTYKGSDTLVNIVYVNKTVDQRFALKDEFRNLGEMLKLIVEEHKNPPKRRGDDDEDEDEDDE